MAQALIRDIDDGLLEEYRCRARRSGRSLQAELRDGLRRDVERSRQDKRELLDRIQAMTPTDREQTPGWQLVREDRGTW